MNPSPVASEGRRARSLTMAPMQLARHLVGTTTIAGVAHHVWSDGRLLPILWGGDDPVVPPAPPAGPQPDLAGLETALNAAKTEAQQQAQADMLKALGFDKRDDAIAWVKAKREEETAGLSELERRERTVAEREAAAALTEANANRIARDARVRAALVTAGAPGEHVGDLAKIVAVPDGEVTDEQLTAAVEATKTKFPALFTGPAAPPAPSGNPAGSPPAPRPNQGGVDPARERARRKWGVTADNKAS